MASFPIANNIAIGIGVISIFPIVAIAVYMFIKVGFKNAPYEFLDKEYFETEYGVTGLAKDKQKTYHSTYMKYNYIGTCGCILSPIPLLCGAFSKNEFLIMISLCITILIVGISVMFFIVAGVRWSSMQKLLKEGDFSDKGKRKSKVTEAVGSVYWLIATTIYLGWSFVTNDWHITWVIWPIAGIIFVVVDIICNLVIDKQDEK